MLPPTEPWRGPLWMAFGDFTGGGCLEVALARPGSLSLVTLGTEGTFVESPARTAITGTGGPLITGDFDGDGLDDLALAVQPGLPWGPYRSLTIFRSVGDGTFTLRGSIELVDDFDVDDFVSGDVNGDGRADIIVSGARTEHPRSQVRTWLSAPTGAFTEVDGEFVDGIVFFGATGDFNADGKIDVVLSGETAQMALSRGDGRFSWRPNAPTMPGAYGPIGDFDGDGRLDLFYGGNRWCTQKAGCWNFGALLPGNGDGTFRAPTIFNGTRGQVEPLPTIVSADFDGDGIDDVGIGQLNAGLQVWLGSMTAPLERTIAIAIDPDRLLGGLVAGDLDGNGRPDILAVENWFGGVDLADAGEKTTLTAVLNHCP